MADNGINFGDFPEYFYTVLNPDSDLQTINTQEAAQILAEQAGVKFDLTNTRFPLWDKRNPDKTLWVFKTIAENLPSQFLQKQSAETNSGFVTPLQYLNIPKLIATLNNDPNWSNIKESLNNPDLEQLFNLSQKTEENKIKLGYVGSEASKQKVLNEYKNNDTWFNFEGIESVKAKEIITPGSGQEATIINPTATNSPIDNLPPATTPNSPITPATTVPPTDIVPTESGTTTTTTMPATTETGAPDLWGTTLGGGLFDEQQWLQENAGATLDDLNKYTESTVDQTFDISGLPSSFKTTLGTDYADKTKLNISAALRYPYQLDKQGVMDLQDNLRRAGWYDRVGQSFKTHGVLDPATETAYQTFMADSVRAGIQPAEFLRDGLTNYVRNRSAEAGIVYRDNDALHQTIRGMGETLIGRGLTMQESDSLIQQIRKWEQTAALGSTFAQENYQIDIDAKAQNAIETQFKAQYMTQTISDALKKAGKA